jgi:hypothetical protein
MEIWKKKADKKEIFAINTECYKITSKVIIKTFFGDELKIGGENSEEFMINFLKLIPKSSSRLLSIAKMILFNHINMLYIFQTKEEKEFLSVKD